MGLKPQIRREVQALQPTSLSQAVGLAKLQENKFFRFQEYFQTFSIELTYSHSPYIPNTAVTAPKRPLLPNPVNTVLIKKLSSAELQLRSEKRLMLPLW